MKLFVLYIAMILLLSSCENNNNILGVYEARYKEKGTLHYVELFPDNTFCHVYEKNGNRKEHRSTFHFYKIKNHYSIDFDEWKDFDERTIEYKKRYHSSVRKNDLLINKGQIFFDMDLYELNFQKK